jgi:hypothetical protein
MSPRYDPVPDRPQLPAGRPGVAATPAAAPTDPWVPITTTIPTSLRRRLSVTCAVKEMLLKDAVTAAVREWLGKHDHGR